MKGILWFDEWGDCDACDISLRLSFKALSPADCHVLWAIWLHCAPEVQEEQWRRENTDTDRQRQRLDLSNDSIQAITLHDGRDKPRRILAKQPCSVPDQGYTAPCLACCHLNSELVASKDRYVSTLPDWGEVNMSAAGGGPPATQTPSEFSSRSPHLSPTICLVQPWERRREKWSLTWTETESSSQPDVHIFIVRLAGDRWLQLGWYLCWCSSSLESFIKNEWQNVSSACLYFFSASAVNRIRKT